MIFCHAHEIGQNTNSLFQELKGGPCARHLELATRGVRQWGWPVGKCFVDIHLLNLISKVASIVDLFCKDLLGIETLKDFKYCRRTELRDRNSKG